MKIIADHPQAYEDQVPKDRRAAFSKLRACILSALPTGFSECMSYGMIGYVVPHSIYPKGYHCTPELPLPFLSIASQKHFIGFYHMGLYADAELMRWFVQSYESLGLRKLDMGKSCIRFKHWDEIPFDLISSLVERVSVESWIAQYEAAFLKNKKRS